MVFGDILPIILVILFWICLAAFTVFFSARALHAPTETETHGADNAQTAH